MTLLLSASRCANRIHRVLDIFADEVGPCLLQNERLTSVKFPTKGKKWVTVGQMRTKKGLQARCRRVLQHHFPSTYTTVQGYCANHVGLEEAAR